MGAVKCQPGVNQVSTALQPQHVVSVLLQSNIVVQAAVVLHGVSYGVDSVSLSAWTARIIEAQNARHGALSDGHYPKSTVFVAKLLLYLHTVQQHDYR